MSLLEAASDFKRSAEAARQAIELRERQAEARSRRICYFKEFGNEWFSQLAKRIETLAASFNEVAGDEATFTSHLDANSEPYSISIALTPQDGSAIARSVSCSILQKHDELKVVLKIPEGSAKSNLECEVRITDFSGFKVHTILKHQKRVIDEEATDRHCDINDEYFFPIFKTVTTEEKKSFASEDEFADFVLTYIIDSARKKR